VVCVWLTTVLRTCVCVQAARLGSTPRVSTRAPTGELAATDGWPAMAQQCLLLLCVVCGCRGQCSQSWP
jgi:hypothetical protein